MMGMARRPIWAQAGARKESPDMRKPAGCGNSIYDTQAIGKCSYWRPHGIAGAAREPGFGQRVSQPEEVAVLSAFGRLATAPARGGGGEGVCREHVGGLVSDRQVVQAY